MPSPAPSDSMNPGTEKTGRSGHDGTAKVGEAGSGDL